MEPIAVDDGGRGKEWGVEVAQSGSQRDGARNFHLSITIQNLLHSRLGTILRRTARKIKTCCVSYDSSASISL